MAVKVPLFHPSIFGDEWIENLKPILNSKWLAQGPQVDLFEQEFGKAFGYDYCVSVNSGTSALDLAYHLIGIKSGDEVMYPVLTCTATGIPLLHRGAKLNFIDINTADLTMNPIDLRDKISSKTKAIVVVNLGGMYCSDSIFDIAKYYKIPVIVDACQQVGVNVSKGDFVCYSFQAIKHFTTGDGGMLVCRNEEDYKRAKNLRWFGIDREAKQKNNYSVLSPSKREICMNIEEAGYKYQMNDIAASLGRVGLKYSNDMLARKKWIHMKYINAFQHILGISYISGGNYQLFCLLIEDRENFLKHMEDKGIECDLVHLRNDIFTIFGGKRQNLKYMNWIEDRYVYIPCHVKLSDDDIEYVVQSVCEFFNK